MRALPKLVCLPCFNAREYVFVCARLKRLLVLRAMPARTPLRFPKIARVAVWAGSVGSGPRRAPSVRPVKQRPARAARVARRVRPESDRQPALSSASHVRPAGQALKTLRTVRPVPKGFTPPPTGLPRARHARQGLSRPTLERPTAQIASLARRKARRAKRIVWTASRARPRAASERPRARTARATCTASRAHRPALGA